MGRIWPIVSSTFGGGQLITVEGDEAAISKLIDTDTGIDALWYRPGLVVPSGVACRVLEDVGYHTFTVRSRTSSGASNTEQAKRWEYLMHDTMGPAWMIQAYIRNGQPTRVALARTIDVLPRVSRDERVNPRDGNLFRYVTFDDVPNVKVWEAA